jgi:hypothetical protein
MNQSTSVLNQNYSLTNSSNYLDSLCYSLEEVMKKYYEFILEFLNVITEHKSIPLKKQEIYKFILFRGIKTISHVFYMILLYSKNLEMAYYHAIKSFYIYIEFIEQIAEDHHSFLKLYSRDATLFVYKKTIYGIPLEGTKQKEESMESEILFLKSKNSNNNSSNIIHEVSKQMETIQEFLFILLDEETEKIGKRFVFQTKHLFSMMLDKGYKKGIIPDILSFFIKNRFAELYFLQLSKEQKKEPNEPKEQNKTEIICYLFESFVFKIYKMKVFDTSKKEKIIEKKMRMTNLSSPEEYIHFLFSL